jgi:YD repeat-containing protein
MTKRLRIIFWLLYSIGTFISCQDNKVEPQLCYLTSIKDRDGRILQSFEYNHKRQLVKHIWYNSSQTTYTLEYNSNGQIIRILESDLSYSDRLQYQFEYTDNGRTVVQKKPYVSGDLYVSRNMQFNTEGLIIQHDNNDGNIQYTRYVYDKTGNLVQVWNKHYDRSTETIRYEFEFYDKQNSPFFTPNSLRMYGQLTGRIVHMKNNAQNVKIYSSDGSLLTTEIYTFLYNAKGYPIEQRRFGTLERIYEYDCP